MTTTPGPAGREPVAVPRLQHGDVIHMQPHQVWRRSPDPHAVNCGTADVEVECLIVVGTFIIVCWHQCAGVVPASCGAVVYDADDSVMRLEAAAA